MSALASSFASAADLSVDMLKKALAANNLPQYGTKEQMFARLLQATSSKKPDESNKTSNNTSNNTSKGLRFPSALAPNELATMQLKLVKCEMSAGKPVYIYEKVTPNKKDDKANGKTVAKTSKTNTCKKSPGKSCKNDDDDDDDDDDALCEPGLVRAEEVMKERLFNKASKESLVALCKDFGCKATGNKRKLAEIVTEQCHNETDTDDSDDDE